MGGEHLHRRTPTDQSEAGTEAGLATGLKHPTALERMGCNVNDCLGEFLQGVFSHWQQLDSLLTPTFSYLEFA